MQMSPPDEHHKKLQALAGQWKGDEIMHPSPWNPESARATSKANAKMGLGGFFLIMEYEQFRNGQSSYSGHGVFGWDQAQGKYTMHWFDVMGMDPGAPALGTWEGNKLQFVKAHPMGHGRYTYEFKPDGSYTFRLENSQDGNNWMAFIDATFQRA